MTHISSECGEAKMPIALIDAAPLHRDAPEARDAQALGERAFQAFMQEALPAASAATHAPFGDLITPMLSAAEKRFSESPRTSGEIEAYTDAMAYMLCACLVIDS